MKVLSNEIVFRGHPDKLADQIGDKILMEYINKDPNSKIDIDVVGGEGVVFITGTVYSSALIDTQQAVKDVLADVGCLSNVDIINGIIIKDVDSAIKEPIVNKYDDCIVFGYACNDTVQKLPKSVFILQEFTRRYDELCKRDKRFLPDGKVQLNGIYDNNKKLLRISSIVVNYQNTEKDRSSTDAILNEILLGLAASQDIEIGKVSFNPRGEYKVGGFERDNGLTGRKTIMGSYQGFVPVGAGAFSGKDPSSVNRSATHKARQIAKSMIDSHDIDWCEVQLMYDETFNELIDIYVDSNIGPLEINSDLYIECDNHNVVKELDLLKKDYMNMSAYGHFQN